MSFDPAELRWIDIAQALVVSAVWVTAESVPSEPSRRSIQAVIVAVAAGAYMNGGLGAWELGFSVLVGFCAFRGLQSHRWIAVGWAFHTGWDVLHHLAGRPMISWLPSSSVNCAVTDAVLAIWFLLGAPDIVRSIRVRRLSRLGTSQ